MCKGLGPTPKWPEVPSGYIRRRPDFISTKSRTETGSSNLWTSHFWQVGPVHGPVLQTLRQTWTPNSTYPIRQAFVSPVSDPVQYMLHLQLYTAVTSVS